MDDVESPPPYDDILYRRGNSDMDLNPYDSASSSSEDEYKEHINATLDHLHFLPTQVYMDDRHSRKSGSSALSRLSAASLGLSSKVLDDGPSVSSKKSSDALQREAVQEDSRCNMLEPTKADRKSTLIVIETSDEEEDPASSNPDLELSSDEKLEVSEEGEVKEVEIKAVEAEPESSLPERFIDATDMNHQSAEDDPRIPKEDFSKWDNGRRRVISGFYKNGMPLIEMTEMFLTMHLWKRPDGEDHLRKRSRASHSPESEFDVIIPCIKCKRDHRAKFPCGVKRCEACMKLHDHETWGCPFFKFSKCTKCQLRFHDITTCPVDNTTGELCTKCPDHPAHLSQYCPRLWRVYVANTEADRKPKAIKKSCSYCGHPHFFDDCQATPKGIKFLTPWNKLPLSERQATVLSEKPEVYAFSEFVSEILHERSEPWDVARSSHSGGGSRRSSHTPPWQTANLPPRPPMPTMGGDRGGRDSDDRRHVYRHGPPPPVQASRHTSSGSPWRNAQDRHPMSYPTNHPPSYQSSAKYSSRPSFKYPNMRESFSANNSSGYRSRSSHRK